MSHFIIQHLKTPPSDYTVLGSPIELSVVVLTDSSVNITWSPPSKHSICLTGYIIRALSDTTEYIITNTSGTTFVLSGLSSGNTYNFSVAGIDKRNITGIYCQYINIYLSGITKLILCKINSLLNFYFSS